jgi:hypothetical protein
MEKHAVTAISILFMCRKILQMERFERRYGTTIQTPESLPDLSV